MVPHLQPSVVSFLDWRQLKQLFFIHPMNKSMLIISIRFNSIRDNMYYIYTCNFHRQTRLQLIGRGLKPHIFKSRWQLCPLCRLALQVYAICQGSSNEITSQNITNQVQYEYSISFVDTIYIHTLFVTVAIKRTHTHTPFEIHLLLRQNHAQCAADVQLVYYYYTR